MAELTAANLQGFDQIAEKKFFGKAVKRLIEYFGEEIASGYTEEQLEAFTRLGIKRARANNVTSEGGILDYILLMSWFGAYVDIDIQYRFLHSHIHLKPEDSLKGKTVHAVRKGEAYEDSLFVTNNTKQTLLLLLEEYIIKAQLVPTTTLQRSSLVKAIEYYFPMNNYLVDTDGLLEELYRQAAPEELGFTTQSTQLVWFILTIIQGVRFHQNPLYPDMNAELNSLIEAERSDEVNKKNIYEVQRQKLIRIIDLMLVPYYRSNKTSDAEESQ